MGLQLYPTNPRNGCCSMDVMLRSFRSSTLCLCSGAIRLQHHSRAKLLHNEQITSTLFAITTLVLISRVGAVPVNKTYPFDPESSSCFFIGRASHFRMKYNVEADLCISLYGRIEIDANMEQVELQQLESIDGCVIISGTKIQHADLRQINHINPNPEFCEYTHALLIYNNRKLTSIEFNNDLHLDRPEDVFIGLNPALAPAGVTGATFKFDFGSGKDCLISEVTAKSKCSRIVGDVKFQQLPEELWETIRVVHGTLRIENSDSVFLNSLTDLKIEGWKLPALVISKNPELMDISTLLTMDVEQKENFFKISDNPKICHNIVERAKLKDWLASRGASIEIRTDCLQSCPGGHVSIGYLETIHRYCNSIKGDLRIQGIKTLPYNIGRLEQIEYINGSLTVRNNEALPDLTFLKNLKIINNSHSEEPGLLIENNTNFNNTGLISLEKVISKTRPTTTAAVITDEEDDKIETEDDIFIAIESTTLEPMNNNFQTRTRKPQKKQNASVVMKKKVAQVLLRSISEALDEEQKRNRIAKAKDAKIVWLVAIIMSLFVLAAIIGIISSIWYKKRTQRMRGGLDGMLEDYASEKESEATTDTPHMDDLDKYC